jgi:hypothetical protein
VSLLAVAIVPISRARASQGNYCVDQVETKAFGCSVGTAHRGGDSLIIKLRDSTLVFVEVSKGDIQRHYKYIGRVGVAGFHLVRVQYYEGPGESLIINPRDGKETAAEWDVVPSPDASSSQLTIGATARARSRDSRSTGSRTRRRFASGSSNRMYAVPCGCPICSRLLPSLKDAS